ncbi:AsnC family transcriptional regulator [Microaerobacter geothermalis]|uniref:siroheme decarboxylase subunit alpha n=1 Tax=Microaerobacter geothermalis TaxID=674972 RepID=UPI001F4188EE|nr:AsnC family transcriptional regulator [Microaerobacter geothermalis]MCF6092678.1 AsnC family transcriptional regulator [Microaerobacter geothermalis]
MVSETLDMINGKLLNRLQKGIPLVERPYQAIAEELNMTEEEVMERIKGMKGKIIRQISAIFDTKSLGYQSSLVAAKVDPELLDQAAEVINQHPGVTHNYVRNHDFNLWFTIAVPAHSRLGLERTVQLLRELAPGVKSIRCLPTLKLFKIGVFFDMSGKVTKGKEAPAYTEVSRKQRTCDFTEAEKGMIRELQKDLSIESRPFSERAEAAGVTEEEFLQTARRFKEAGIIRRFAAVLYHREAGFLANGMGVWNIPADKAEEIGCLMASFKAVTHCYLRPTYEDWPYNIFTMVHGRNKEECEDALKEIENEIGYRDRLVLYSSKQYKKERLSYFTPEIDEWESKFDLKMVAKL